jgi:hypothetical protein
VDERVVGHCRVAQVGVTDPEIFPCTCGVGVFAGPASRVTPTVTTAAMARVIDTYEDPDIVPAGGALVVGFEDPEIMPGERRLLTARVRADCRGVTAAQIKAGLGVTIQAGDLSTAVTTVALPATPR